MAYWGNRVRYKIKSDPPLKLSGGVNTYISPFELGKHEASDSMNTSSRLYPALTTRERFAVYWSSGGNEYYNYSTNPLALGKRNDNPIGSAKIETIVFQSGTELIGAYGTTIASGLTASRGTIIEFSTDATRYTILMNGTDKKAWDGTTVSDIADAPATRLITTDDYRLYALLNNNIYCTAEGSITDWTTAGDADKITVTSMIGEGTAITAYKDYVIAWSEQSMHILQGDDPGNFILSDAMPDGCISDRTVIQHKGILYWLDNGEFKGWDGGKPFVISQKIKHYLDNINNTYKYLAAAGSWNKYIYLSIPYGSTATRNNITLVYDSEYGVWHVWGQNYVPSVSSDGPFEKGVAAFVNLGENIYGFSNYGVTSGYWYNTRLSDYEGNTEGTSRNLYRNDLYWYHITGVINENLISQKKTLSSIWVLFKLPEYNLDINVVDPEDGIVALRNRLRISYSTTVDSDDFTELTTIYEDEISGETVQRIQIPTTALQNVDYYRLKFSGNGPCTIYGIEYEYRVKAR